MSTKNNFGFSHKCGILLHVSSLPSRYGIGSFGKEAYEFVDFLSLTGQRCWQVLPLNPTSYGDSPYQSPASVAGNPYFIDLPTLFAAGLLTKDELKGAEYSSERIDYGRLFNTRYELLRRAYSRFEKNAAYRAFCKKNAAWIEDYALFMALKVHYGFCEWTGWSDEHRSYSIAVAHASDFSEEMDFWRWVQYTFMTQWRALRDYAHAKKITIIGDMPIYVAHDSMEVWRSPEQFLLDENYAPIRVAGCPPDAYAEDGQLWGNPLYNWQRMQDENFSWWCERVGYAFNLYDILRIDHFRGFASYYSIPYGDENARRGEWVEAPGKQLFDRIREKYPKSKIIAEDLGFITDDVRELLRYTGFPGMKILQFAFYDEGSEYLPRNYTTDNSVVYSGSHDADCTKSWYKSLTGATKARFLRECPRKKGQTPTYAAIELAMRSRANLAVIPMQDYLGLENSEGRMNTPSMPTGNWQWRMKKSYNRKALRERLLKLAEETERV